MGWGSVAYHLVRWGAGYFMMRLSKPLRGPAEYQARVRCRRAME